MLSEKEIRRVKRYAALPILGLAAMAVSILSIFVVLALTMLDDLVFYNSANIYRPALYAWGIIVLCNLAFFAWAFISVRLRLMGRSWQEIRYKVGLGPKRMDSNLMSEAMEAQRDMRITGVADVSVGFGLAGWMRENAEDVAKAAGIELPPVRKQVIAILLVPVLLLTALYIPEFVRAGTTYDANRQAAHHTLTALADCFEKADLDPHYADPLDTKSRAYYDFRVGSSDDQGFFSAEVSQEGLIQKVTYTYNIDGDVTSQQNLELMQENLRELQKIFSDAFAGENRILLAAEGLADAVPFDDSAAKAFAEAYISENADGMRQDKAEVSGGVTVNYSLNQEMDTLYLYVTPTR